MNEKTFFFKPCKARIRATFGAGFMGDKHLGKIEADKGILHDVQVCSQGEAKGHDVFLGEDFISDVVAKGNAAKIGVKVRFGHPAMCSDALGTFLGYAKNFRAVPLARTDGEKALCAVADVYLSDSAKVAPSGDLYSWVLKTAADSPSSFGQSIVFTYQNFYVLDKDGKKLMLSDFDSQEVWMSHSADGKVYAVLDELLGSDFTDTPAATDGVFSADSLAGEAERMIEENPQIFSLLTSNEKAVSEFISRYNAILTEAKKPALCVCSASELSAAKKLAEDAEKRMAGLQAAKDKEIAEWKKKVLDSEKSFNDQIAAGKAALASLAKEKQAAVDDLSKCRADLSELGKQLQAEKEAREKLVGSALKTGTGDVATFQDAVAKFGYVDAVKNYPHLHDEFMAAIKK